MVWFGIVRDDEAISQWQRADALRRATSDPQRRVAERVGRWVGLPLIATTATVLAVVPGTIVPPTSAAPVAPAALAQASVDPGGPGFVLRAEGHDPDLETTGAAGGSQDDRVAARATALDAAKAAKAVALLRTSGPVGPAGAVGASGIPVTLLAAYRAAEASLRQSDAACHLPWWLLAGIGRIESGHASGGRVTADGTTRGRILGPRLDGSLAGTAVIGDTDGGALDGDPAYDRAVGPMQFLPGTWRSWGRDGNADGVKDPSNVFDATLGAGAYLCAGGRDLATDSGIAAAVLSYNYSQSYLDSVVSWGIAYRDGVTPTDDGEGTIPAPPATGTSPTTGPKPTTTRPPTTPTRTPTATPTRTPTRTPTPTSTGSPTTTTPTTPPTCPTATGTTTGPAATSTPSTTPGPGCPTPTGSPTSTSTTSASSTTTTGTSTPTGTRTRRGGGGQGATTSATR